MNESTEKNINEAINWIQETASSVQDFAIEQAPLYCREVVSWELWSGITLICSGLIAILAGIFILRKIWKSTDNNEEYIFATSFAFGVFVLLPSLIAIAFGLENSIKAAVAPRVLIIEHLKDICK